MPPAPPRPLPLSGTEDAGAPDRLRPLLEVAAVPVLRAEPTLRPWPGPVETLSPRRGEEGGEREAGVREKGAKG